MTQAEFNSYRFDSNTEPSDTKRGTPKHRGLHKSVKQPQNYKDVKKVLQSRDTVNHCEPTCVMLSKTAR